MWLFRDLLNVPTLPRESSVSLACYATPDRALQPRQPKHTENVEVQAELKRPHCTWFKSRLPHLFLMLEQLADEISVCVSRRPLGQTVWHPEIFPLVQYWADLHTAWPWFTLLCLFFSRGGERRAHSNVRWPSLKQFSMACCPVYYGQ